MRFKVDLAFIWLFNNDNFHVFSLLPLIIEIDKKIPFETIDLCLPRRLYELPFIQHWLFRSRHSIDWKFHCSVSKHSFPWQKIIFFNIVAFIDDDIEKTWDFQYYLLFNELAWNRSQLANRKLRMEGFVIILFDEQLKIHVPIKTMEFRSFFASFEHGKTFRITSAHVEPVSMPNESVLLLC